MGIFKIDADALEWIDGARDDPKDLCLHGHVKVQIGDILLEGHGTVSATGLYLLKSLTEDKLMTNNNIQMVPCCGHFMIANDDLSDVQIIGCNNGTDWSVIHAADKVKIVLASGKEEIISFSDYEEQVFRFADKIEAFYHTSMPKNIPEDEFDRNGYTAFWNEWHRRREN